LEFGKNVKRKTFVMRTGLGNGTRSDDDFTRHSFYTCELWTLEISEYTDRAALQGPVSSSLTKESKHLQQDGPFVHPW